ncbi:alpha/beta hydrolase [Actinokineospora sp. PR83]|uniref:alpha/beta hydrolase n=1 Tax=Actinokineospora sp. PR83 TaxID=2884908 RepID=UPI001F35D4EC|nr:alpha/beta hydrolase [Actinokineospora sp. PR83]MCG8920480.1 alpha/beta hydrolase [Actinokineospora sp. PR83]
MKTPPRRPLARLIAVAALVAGATGGIAAPAVAAPTPPTPVAWGPCAYEDLVTLPATEVLRYSCARHPVPIDPARPQRGTVELALMRRAADNPDTRIGSLFLNPGGPGGSGYKLPQAMKNYLSPEVLSRFDLIGFDPRGVGRSSPVRCFTTQEDNDALNARISAIPLTEEQERSTNAAYGDYGRACGQLGGPLLNHMSTEHVARDLELLRAGVGDAKLNFLGFSYGTLIGATYANLFPQNARAIVLDGNVDPLLRTTNGLEYDRQRTEGFELALDELLTQCDSAGPAACAFSGDAKAKFTELRDTAERDGTLRFPALSPDWRMTFEAFTNFMSTAVYNQAVELPTVAILLQSAYDALHPSGARARTAATPAITLPPNAFEPSRDILPDSPYTSDDSYSAVNCTDKPFLHWPGLVPPIADAWDRAMPTFGRGLAWGDPGICVQWPFAARWAERYTGPWNRSTPNPVLLVGNTHDPATRYAFSQRMSTRLGNARLVTVEAIGHTILGRSTCADRIATDYLINLAAPAKGTVCQPNEVAFPAR